ncbi:MAG: hypothetical protein ABI596_14805 [Pyrinomonadaceae bacterium]
MSKETHNDQTLQRYLLGALPDSEAERLDELGLTDDEFAEALRIAESDLIDAYVQNELSGTVLDQFKTYYLASPLRREKVKFAQAFQVFALKEASVQTAGLTGKTARVRKGAGWFSAVSDFFAPRLALQWGAALAALALVIAGSWLVFDNVRLRQEMSQVQARREVLARRELELQKQLETQRANNTQTEQELARVRQEQERLGQELKQTPAGAKSSREGSIVSLILAPPLRGASQVPTISIKPGSSQVAAQLQLEATDYSAYRVALIDPAGNQTLWRSGSLKPTVKGERKSLAASFRADLLKPRHYLLTVTGISGGTSEIVGNYPFRVVK